MQKYLFAVLMVFSTVLFPAHSAQATNVDNFSVLALRNMCLSTSNIDYGYCAGYISAIAHVLATQGHSGYNACHMDRVRSQQLVDTFNAWAELFPNALNKNAGAGVAAALARSFPCKRKPY